MTRERIGVFGAGLVGLVTAACLAELGHDVTVYDVDAVRIARLREGRVPFHEPGLTELVARTAAAGRLHFTPEPEPAVAGKRLVFIAVGTPPDADGRPDLSGIGAAAAAIARYREGATVVVNKSTGPIDAGAGIGVVSNPEFLRSGTAIADFMNPDRIVVGSSDPAAVELLREVYAPLGAPLLVTDVRSAEMIKYAANAFLATKISFVNEIASICERTGADIAAVAEGIGADPRIGPEFLRSGLGFGGSCLPKDVAALQHIAADGGIEPLLLAAVFAVNTRRIDQIADRIAALLGGLAGRTIAVLGLAFKPGTDDVRESPAVALVEALLARGARVRAHDPVAVASARRRLGARVQYAAEPLAAAGGADALVLATEWPEYAALDPFALAAMMRRRIVVDARNALDGERFTRAGFVYHAAGRPAFVSDRIDDTA